MPLEHFLCPLSPILILSVTNRFQIFTCSMWCRSQSLVLYEEGLKGIESGLLSTRTQMFITWLFNVYKCLQTFNEHFVWCLRRWFYVWKTFVSGWAAGCLHHSDELILSLDLDQGQNSILKICHLSPMELGKIMKLKSLQMQKILVNTFQQLQSTQY